MKKFLPEPGKSRTLLGPLKINRLTKEQQVGRPWISITLSGKEYDLMPALIVIALVLIYWSM